MRVGGNVPNAERSLLRNLSPVEAEPQAKVRGEGHGYSVGIKILCHYPPVVSEQ